ncbi:piggyBac transposable element-derived protein 4-like, partial [Ylistrum balloti]|uniref:piggyBac transposable element-derived protein 4-like n=1 Tax=Ylistrum balloti TaxID=509963 RepID=UPI002905D44C
MAEDEFHDFVGNSDSEDEEFLGFNLDEIRDDIEQGDVDGEIKLNEDEIAEIMREVDEEMYREERDPTLDAYECNWLRDFTEQPGPRHIDENASEYDIFSKIVNEEIISLLMEETNILPAATAKGFTTLMSRDRFLNILAYFHAADNDLEPPRESPNYDPTYKFSKLARLLIRNWQRYYCPHREMSTDETLIPFKGRTKFIQYIPSKPHKWGLKVWTLAESKTGYMYNWEMYTGKQAATNDARGIAHRVVINICSPIVDKGYHLYYDNYFSSPALFRELCDKQIGACGTLRTNRVGVPAVVKTAKPPKGESIVHRDGRFLYISFMDKRLVNVITTVHNGSTYTKRVRSRFHENHFREVEHPMAIQLYTKYMGGVDSADQQTQYCVTQHRMLKWWKKLVLCSLLEISFCNAKILWKHFNPGMRKYCSNNFRLAVISGLLEGYERQNNKKFVRPAANPPSRMTERHFPSLNPSITPGGRRSNPDCE